MASKFSQELKSSVLKEIEEVGSITVAYTVKGKLTAANFECK